MNPGTLRGFPEPGHFGLLQIQLDGVGSTIGTGIQGDIEVPYDCELRSWRLFATASGSIVLDVWRGSAHPQAAAPTSSSSITGAEKPTLSSQTRAQGQQLLRWSKTLKQGDLLRVNVDSATTVQKVTLVLEVMVVAR